MTTAALPSNETQRLEALHSYGILDTAPELEYDDFTLLAAQICGTPIALISLIDQDRQWFKSRVGVDETETTRDIAFCAHAILEPSHVFVVPDAAEDGRFQNNPFVKGDLHVRFYAGAPLVTSDNFALGTLCVIDQKVRELNEDQLMALQALARQIAAQLELRRTRRKLSDQNQELTQLNAQKNQFIGMAAHDLRNPLQVIEGYSKLLLNGVAGEINPMQSKALDAVTKNCNFMLHLINDLLEISSLESGEVQLSLHSVDIGKLVEKNVSLNRLLAEAKKIRLDFEASGEMPVVQADEFRIEQVCNNLISNAIKFSHSGTTVHVRLERLDGAVRLSVQDEGQGIPAQELEKLFQPFATSSVKGTAGEASTGLGLYIVKRIVEAHGGSVTVDSTPGVGSTFSLTLPATL